MSEIHAREIGLVTKLIKAIKINHIATGHRYRVARIKKGISLREVARRLNYAPAYISDLERGRRNWTPRLANKFTDILLDESND